MSYSIRQLTGADVTAYRAIRLEALVNHPESYGTSPEAFSARSDATLVTQLTNLTYFGVITDAGELAGIAAFAIDDGERERHRGWVMQVYVTQAMRGTGAALAMLEAVAEHARAHVIQLHLMVGAHNAPAIRLYEKAGFKTYGTDPRCLQVNGRYIDEHMMVRFLDEAPGKTNENV
ncbi:GNAT family protein [Devosia sp.]|uniref:GNAT family N-acetyltransferase n=1 Tax=Devosia sp. TaxID=1871048 RepID=UPI00292E5932|nr:GNAT family protein [Devosia sp.]